MKLSFVVVTYKRGTVLQHCLDSIYMQEGLPKPYEIIVVDNGNDAQIRPPADSSIDLRIEHLPQNLGAAGGRNLGMRLAQGDILVLLDDDATWHEATDVARLISHFETDTTCGAAVGQSRTPEGQPIVVELPHPNKTYILNTTAPVEVPYCYVTGVAFRAPLMQQLGGYPERFQIYMEELDLSLRLIDAGYHIVYDPSVATYHYKSNLGRPVVNVNYWKNNAINKSRMAWRLLPFPYPLTVSLIWTVYALIKTRKPHIVLEIWRTLGAERAVLARERTPIRPETVRYLRKIGARLVY